MKWIDLLGSRVVKTGVAVFITAIICYWLNWPPVFAVITAIVTLEPTVTDSVKKGIIRFPASIIGSGYAVIFIALFGNSPLTYTLAAVLTIATCFKLNLHAGLLVATLTSVTMVGVIEGNYIVAFLTRLGTTSIGLLVSTGVNMFVLPPDYSSDIVKNITHIRKRTGAILQNTFFHLVDTQAADSKVAATTMEKLHQKLNQTETFVRFQNDESTYHPLVGKEKRQFLKAEAQLSWLRMLHYHLDNLHHMPVRKVSWTTAERDVIKLAVTEVGTSLQDPKDHNPEKHRQRLKQLKYIFWGDNKDLMEDNEIYPTTFPPELIILYELVAIYNVVDRLYREEKYHRSAKRRKSNRLDT